MNPIKALFPVGFRFQPTDEELVGYFLFKKINGHSIIQDGKIKDIDVYQHDPMELYDPNFDYGDGKMYFFTPLHMIRSNGQRVKRNTKHGFWRATQKCTNILDSSGNTIGVKMPLAYYSLSQNSTPHKSSWLMSEYRLSNEYISSTECHNPSMVERIALCVIYQHEKGKKMNICNNYRSREDNVSKVSESNGALPPNPIRSSIPCSFLNPDNSILDSNQNNQIPYFDPNPNNLTYTTMKPMHEDKVSEVAESIIAPPSIPISSPIPYSYSDLSNNLIPSSLDPVLDYIPTFDNSFLSPI